MCPPLSLQEGSCVFVFLASEALQLKWWRTKSRSFPGPKRQPPVGPSFGGLGIEGHLFPLPLGPEEGRGSKDGEEEMGQSSKHTVLGSSPQKQELSAGSWSDSDLHPPGIQQELEHPVGRGARSQGFQSLQSPLCLSFTWNQLSCLPSKDHRGGNSVDK